MGYINQTKDLRSTDNYKYKMFEITPKYNHVFISHNNECSGTLHYDECIIISLFILIFKVVIKKVDLSLKII